MQVFLCKKVGAQLKKRVARFFYLSELMKIPSLYEAITIYGSL